jgi:NADP-dependent 3-hydroxy acid dehydrogenase YdfG
MSVPAQRIAVVTGASSGVGRAIALELARKGTKVYLVARRAEVLRTVAQEAQADGAAPIVYACDIAADDAVRNLADHVATNAGRIDVLVHSAGVYARGDTSSATLDQFDALYRTNLRATYALTQALLPLLVQSGGDIVFINSSIGLTARAGVGQFSATNHALKAIANSLRDEINAQGVRVLSVFLGRTATPRQEVIHGHEDKPYRPERLIQPRDVATTVVSALGLPRTVEITDIVMRPGMKP